MKARSTSCNFTFIAHLLSQRVSNQKIEACSKRSIKTLDHRDDFVAKHHKNHTSETNYMSRARRIGAF